MATSGPEKFSLSPLDNTMPRAHVPKLFFLPGTNESDVSTVIKTLRDGLSKTLEALTPLSGTMQATGLRGELCVTAPWSSVDDIFRVNDLRHEGGLDYQQLKDNDFPLQGLDMSLLPLADMMKSEKAVLIVQVNIIKGGVILVPCLHHSFTDGNGAVAINRVWAAYCRGEDGSQLVTREMTDRQQLMQGWGNATLDEFPEYRVRPIESEALAYEKIAANATTQSEGAIFFFPKRKMLDLKAMASAMESGEDGGAWISTNDALCALISCCVNAATDEETSTTADKSCSVLMVVDGRGTLKPPLPKDFIGNVTTFVKFVVPHSTFDSAPAQVANVAHLIRSQIKRRDERSIRRVISAMSSVEDVSRVMLKTASASESELSFTSCT